MENVEAVTPPFKLSPSPSDDHSYSEPDKVCVRHIDLDLEACFDERILRGSVVLTVEKAAEYMSAPLILDTRRLCIHSVEASSDGRSFISVEYKIGPEDPILGAPLRISLLPAESKVRIRYSTSGNASGLQWLDPAQTAGKDYPFLYTQSQTIHARSWIPVQDSPAVRLTYSAQVRTPRDLLAVMSGGNNPPATRGESHSFRMVRPIPPYLLALAVGDLDFISTSSRTGVYAERPVVARAADEFKEAEEMLRVAEELYGRYLWGRFDILVLPPSFPFGGMENPGVAFVTPTLIAGDRSAISVIAHELAHAWSGNLVTNATWRDFWLNEGYTTYIEYRLQGRLYGKARADMEQVLAQQRLIDEMKTLEPRDQVLHIDLTGRDPDCGATLVPYVKGALFLKSLEETVGERRFDDYLKNYFDHFNYHRTGNQLLNRQLA